LRLLEIPGGSSRASEIGTLQGSKNIIRIGKLVKASAWQEMNIGFRHTSKMDGRNPAPPKGWLNPYK